MVRGREGGRESGRRRERTHRYLDNRQYTHSMITFRSYTAVKAFSYMALGCLVFECALSG